MRLVPSAVFFVSWVALEQRLGAQKEEHRDGEGGASLPAHPSTGAEPRPVASNGEQGLKVMKGRRRLTPYPGTALTCSRSDNRRCKK